ncbi:MAG: DEAD/DEAH box helicase [Candidatus Woesearchaeota archaeon]|nr:MAG: DEAD/DEAH box helicase [Candidatus Woesearchaeota archaeon]
MEKARAVIPTKVFAILSEKTKQRELRACQRMSIDKGLFSSKNILVCSPTGSGKTLVAELAMLNAVLEKGRKAIYLVPLKALASEKYQDFKKKYGAACRIGISSGDLDTSDDYLASYDIIIATVEKFDSLLRHRPLWIGSIGCVVADEIHLLTDPGRGPALEIVLTIMKTRFPSVQLIGLSATIGNPQELGSWLEAEVVLDTYRPVPLKKGILFEHEIEFLEDDT